MTIRIRYLTLKLRVLCRVLRRLMADQFVAPIVAPAKYNQHN
jgi:hypothetical protein